MVIQSWVGWARTRGLTLLLPDLARIEILTLRPDAAELVEDLTGHPHVLIARLDGAERDGVEVLLEQTGTCDVLAAWVAVLCRRRGWPTLSGDPARLRRIAPDLDVQPL